MMHRTLWVLGIALVGCGIACQEPVVVTKPVVSVGKTVLFNGKDLTGWQMYLKDTQADPKQTWSVRDGVMRCTGAPTGYIQTSASYANYRLHVEWRWPGQAGNSGVLLHKIGDDAIWPTCIEAQLKSDHAGDFVVMGGADFKEHKGKKGRVISKKNSVTENPPGLWNSYDILCKDGTIEVRVNGVLQNTATECTVRHGRICLQSEGVAIEFRNLYLEPID